jgi:hypothetical protein
MVSKFSQVRRHRFLVISLPAAEKGRSPRLKLQESPTNDAPGAPGRGTTSSTHTSSTPYEDRQSWVEGGIASSSVISLSAISSAVTSKVNIALALAISLIDPLGRVPTGAFLVPKSKILYCVTNN